MFSFSFVSLCLAIWSSEYQVFSAFRHTIYLLYKKYSSLRLIAHSANLIDALPDFFPAIGGERGSHNLDDMPG